MGASLCFLEASGRLLAIKNLQWKLPPSYGQQPTRLSTGGSSSQNIPNKMDKHSASNHSVEFVKGVLLGSAKSIDLSPTLLFEIAISKIQQKCLDATNMIIMIKLSLKNET